MSETPLIPRKVFFGNPDRESVQLSPDGKYISWLAPWNGVLNVWVAPKDDLAAARVVTRDTGRGIRMYLWASTNSHILYMQDRNGDENWHLYSIDLSTGEARDLAPFDGVRVHLEAVSHKYPQEIVVGLNNRNPQWHDIYRINVVSGERTLLVQHDRFGEVFIDNDYRPRLAAQVTANGGELFVADGDEWLPWDSIPQEDMLLTLPTGFDESNRVVYMRDSRGRDKIALLEIDVDTKDSRELASDPRCDLADVLLHPAKKHVQAVSFIYDRKKWVILDPDIQADFDYLSSAADGEAGIASRTLDDGCWVVYYAVDDGPVRFYLYDRKSKDLTFLFTNRKDLEGKRLSKMHSAIIKSRDGLDLVGYYTLPAGSDSDGDGIPDRPLPMVFTPHGGPWWRDFWGYNSWHQWLANRGYAVLSVNFRASTGFGKAFINAGDRQWGGKIMEDQIDAVNWAIGKGIADAKRVAVMGGSFGGYSTLAGLTFYPDVFACGVDMVGVANLITWFESMPEYWRPMLDIFIARVGDPRTEEGRALLREHSPLTHVDRIRKPLLIGQGANDPRVRKAESDQILEAMQAKGLPVTYLLYPDEGHGFMRPENNRSFHAVAEVFLAENLGGRSEGIGNDCEGSSIEVLAGLDDVPGLETALSSGS